MPCCRVWRKSFHLSAAPPSILLFYFDPFASPHVDAHTFQSEDLNLFLVCGRSPPIIVVVLRLDCREGANPRCDEAGQDRLQAGREGGEEAGREEGLKNGSTH